MNEHEQLADVNNYKIYIQQKFNRREKTKTRYLTRDFDFCENIKNAFEFNDFQEAENIIREKRYPKISNQNPRIIIKYFENIAGEIPQ